MRLFLTNKKREQINDDIDDINMKIYHCRCRIEEAEQNKNDKLVDHEENKIAEYESEIAKLKKKLR